jgi:hypothetical protein
MQPRGKYRWRNKNETSENIFDLKNQKNVKKTFAPFNETWCENWDEEENTELLENELENEKSFEYEKLLISFNLTEREKWDEKIKT